MVLTFALYLRRYLKRKKMNILENVSLAFDEKFADAYWHRLDNTTEHRTNYYNHSTLILRRGQPFKFTARLNRPFDPSTDKIKLQLRFGSNPDLRLGTEIIAETIPENNTWTPSWFLEIEENDESPIVTVHSPPDALIGRYKVAIYIESVIDGVKHHALDNEPGETLNQYNSQFYFSVRIIKRSFSFKIGPSSSKLDRPICPSILTVASFLPFKRVKGVFGLLDRKMKSIVQMTR